MNLDIQKFYDHPKVLSKEFGDLVLFCYSRECQYDNSWDEITMAARGIIFNKITGEITARPFIKFFNAGEIEGKVDLKELAKKPFLSLKKIDGSFAIHFRYLGEDYIATKGSFESDQAQWATKWFRKHIDSSKMLSEYSYLFEMIYPENQIVVDYGDREDLVLLGAINKRTGEEMPYKDLVLEADRIGASITEAVEFNNLDELYKYCKSLPCSEEGFVITFHNGLKIKVKGDEYCKIHRMLANMTPLAFWRAWDLELQDIPKNFLVLLPEEFRELMDTLYQQVYDLHHNLFKMIKNMYEELMTNLSPDIDHQTLFSIIVDKYPKYRSYLIFYHKKKYFKIWWSIHQDVRPTFNVLPDSIAGSARLKRIMDDI
jgi:RNA ligase